MQRGGLANPMLGVVHVRGKSATFDTLLPENLIKPERQIFIGTSVRSVVLHYRDIIATRYTSTCSLSPFTTSLRPIEIMFLSQLPLK